MKTVFGLVGLILLLLQTNKAFAQYGDSYNSPVPVYTTPPPSNVPFPNVVDTISIHISPNSIPDLVPSEKPSEDTKITYPENNTTAPSDILPDSTQLPPPAPIIPPYMINKQVPPN